MPRLDRLVTGGGRAISAKITIEQIQLSDCSPRVLGIDADKSRLDCQFLADFRRLENVLVFWASQLDLSAQVDYSRIQSLTISGNSMSSKQDFCFAPLVNLETLDLSDNIFLKINSCTFSGLSKLRELYLRNVGLGRRNAEWRTGTIFRGLDELCLLNLSKNPLNRLTPQLFAYTPKLERLVLKSSFIISIRNQPFRHLANLKYLDLSYNSIRLLYTGLSSLKSLELLRLDSNQMQRIVRTNFRNLDQLRFLSIGSCEELIKPRVFEDLKNLEHLWLSYDDIDEKKAICNFYADKNINLYFE